MSRSPTSASIEYDPTNSTAVLNAEAGYFNSVVTCESVSRLDISGNAGAVSFADQPCICNLSGVSCDSGGLTLDGFTAEGTYSSSGPGSGHFKFTDATNPNSYNAGCSSPDGTGGFVGSSSGAAEVRFSVPCASHTVRLRISSNAVGSGNAAWYWSASIDHAAATTWSGSCSTSDCAPNSAPGVDQEITLTPGSHSLTVQGASSTSGACPVEALAAGVMSGDLSFELSDVPVPPPNLEFVDPNPTLLDRQGKLVQDAAQLATGERVVTGAAADGVTLVLLRLRSDCPVTFSLVDPAEGELSTLDGSGHGPSVNATPRYVGDQQWAFALYTPPLNFSAEGDTGFEKEIGFNGDGAFATTFLKLVRPPVVLVHGVWSDLTAWSGLEQQLESDKFDGFPVFGASLVDYGGLDPAPSFDPRKPSVAVESLIGSTETVLRSFRNRGIAVTQVDVVGHSLGGLVARARVAYGPLPYRNRQNLMRGDFHKLITVGSPHYGTKLADFLLANQCDAWSAWTGDKTLKDFFEKTLKKPLGEAIYGFQTRGANSPLAALGATHVPSHAIVGYKPADSHTQRMLNKIFDWSGNHTTIDDVLSSDLPVGQHVDNDTIVPVFSQEGGLPQSSVTQVHGVVHANFQRPWYRALGVPDDVGETESSGADGVWDAVEQYLREPIGPEAFGFFPALQLSGVPVETYPCVSSLGVSSNVSGAFTRGAIAKSAASVSLTPTPGTVVKPGDTVTVSLSITDGNPVEGVLFVAGGGLYEVDGTQPLSASFRVGTQSIGRMDIDVGTFGPGPENYSASTFVVVQPSASLTSLEVPEASLHFTSLGRVAILSVSGNYTDDVQRDLTTAEKGTTYATISGTDAVVSVSPNGLVTATGDGQDGIVISNGGVTTTVEATVQVSNHPPVLPTIADVTLKAGTAIGISVFATDPDGDRVSLSAVSLPPFATLTSYGGSYWYVVMRPGLADTGVFYAAVLATDDGEPQLGLEKSFLITVTPPEGASTTTTTTIVDGGSTTTTIGGGDGTTTTSTIHAGSNTTTSTTVGGGSTTTTTSLGMSTTTTTLPCTSARCALAALPRNPACLGQTIPGKITRQLTKAAGLIDHADSTSSKHRRKLLKRAKKALQQATMEVARAASGKGPLSPACANVLRDGLAGIVGGLGV